MNCFLIDFENVKSAGLKGIEYLTDNDDVYIFYSDYANSITFDAHHKMNQSNANIQFFKSTTSGKNALDFQLISYLGYLIAQKKYKNYFVITDDRGFESAVKFWKDFFKQNKLSDLDINRFRNIQDALDKKSVQFRQSIRKNSPTIPTVEAELELQQLKAENVIIDRNSPQIEKHIEKNLVSNTVDTKVMPSTNINNKKNQTNVVTENINGTILQTDDSLNKNKPIFVNKNTPEENASTVEKNQPNTSNNSSNIDSKNVSNNTSAHNITDVPKYREDKFKNPKNKPMNNTNNKNNLQQNNKKITNQSNKKIVNNKKLQGNQIAKGNDSIKNNYVERIKNFPKDLTESIKPKKVFKDTPTVQPKSFIFGKINSNQDANSIESIQKKQVNNKEKETVSSTISKDSNNKTESQSSNILKTENETSQEKSKNVLSKPPTDSSKTDKRPMNTNNKSNNKPSYKAEKSTAIVPTNSTIISVSNSTIDIPKTDNPKVEKTSSSKLDIKSNVNKSNIESSKEKNQLKRKVGRPRTRPVQDESKKPKNNKKFQGDIPNEKLNSMLEKVSILSGLESYSQDDKIKTCKIVAFSNTKQECYQAFMSCFGKSKGVEIYKIVKQEYDALKNLFFKD